MSNSSLFFLKNHPHSTSTLPVFLCFPFTLAHRLRPSPSFCVCLAIVSLIMRGPWRLSCWYQLSSLYFDSLASEEVDRVHICCCWVRSALYAPYFHWGRQPLMLSSTIFWLSDHWVKLRLLVYCKAEQQLQATHGRFEGFCPCGVSPNSSRLQMCALSGGDVAPRLQFCADNSDHPLA